MNTVAYSVCTLIVLLLSVGVLCLRSGSSERTDTKLLVCQTAHTRFFPVRHSFTYPLLHVYFRIDAPGRNTFWAVDKWRIFHVRSEDYLGCPPCGKSLMDKLKWHLKQHGIITSSSMQAYMMTMPRFFGYSFNPLTTYYIYNPKHIATVLEVHNTFGEKHIYVVPYSSRSSIGGHTISRRFHVSPFNDRLGTYQFGATPPQKGISVELTLVTPEDKPKLVATLKSISESRLDDTVEVLRLCVLCGWWIFMSMPRILWEAWKLHYRKGLPVYMRPEPFHDKGTIGRQASRSIDLYFKKLALDYFRWRGNKITFKILSANTLNPEVVEINPPGKEITVLSELFFTNLICGEPIDSLYVGDILKIDIEEYVRGLNWRKRREYRYMKAKAMALIWTERELFGRIATFADDTKGKG